MEIEESPLETRVTSSDPNLVIQSVRNSDSQVSAGAPPLLVQGEDYLGEFACSNYVTSHVSTFLAHSIADSS